MLMLGRKPAYLYFGYEFSCKDSVSKVAHASATALSGSAPPGKVAHPASIRWLSRLQDLTALSSVTKSVLVVAASWNLLAQMGAKAETSAVSLAALTFSSTVLPSSHPPQLNPTINVAIAPTAKP